MIAQSIGSLDATSAATTKGPQRHLEERRPGIVHWLAAMVVAGALASHFAVTLLYNLPANPIKYALQRPIMAYMEPYFSQNWAFFAPQPISYDYSIIAIGFDGKSWTNTINVTKPLIDANRANRFSPIGAVTLLVSNATLAFTNRTIAKKGVDFKKKREVPISADPVDITVLSRVAGSVLSAVYPETKFKRVRIGMLMHRYARFNERWSRSPGGDLLFWVEPMAFPADVARFPNGKLARL